jgi:hypothetical protein
MVAMRMILKTLASINLRGVPPGGGVNMTGSVDIDTSIRVEARIEMIERKTGNAAIDIGITAINH